MARTRIVLLSLLCWLLGSIFLLVPEGRAYPEEQSIGWAWRPAYVCFAGGNEDGLYFLVRRFSHSQFTIWHFLKEEPDTGCYKTPVKTETGADIVRSVRCTSDSLVISTPDGVVVYFCAERKLGQPRSFSDQCWDIDPGSGRMLGIGNASLIEADEKGGILKTVPLPPEIANCRDVSAWWNTDASVVVHSPGRGILGVLDLNLGRWDTYSGAAEVHRISSEMFEIKFGDSSGEGSIRGLCKARHKWRTSFQVLPGKIEDIGESWRPSMQRDVILQEGVAIQSLGIVADTLLDTFGKPLLYMDRWGVPYGDAADHRLSHRKWNRDVGRPNVAWFEGKVLLLDTQSEMLSTVKFPGTFPYHLQGISTELVAVEGSQSDLLTVLSADGIVSKYVITDRSWQCVSKSALVSIGDNRVCAAFPIPQGFVAVHEGGVGAWDREGKRLWKERSIPAETIAFPDQSGRFLATLDFAWHGLFSNTLKESVAVYSLEGLLSGESTKRLVSEHRKFREGTNAPSFDPPHSNGFVGASGIFCMMASEFAQWDLAGLGRAIRKPFHYSSREDFGFGGGLIWTWKGVFDLMSGEAIYPGFRIDWFEIRSRVFEGSDTSWFLLKKDSFSPRVSRLFALPANWQDLRPEERFREFSIPEPTFDFVVMGGRLVCLSEYGQILSVQALPEELKK
ncbi:MAG: hypothetical protein WC712_02990 [Candidatus Brocadiia bacterium]